MPAQINAVSYCRTITIILLYYSLLGVFACTDTSNKPNKITDPGKLKEPLLRANQHMVRNEDAQIEAYLARYHWNMTRTATGLRYWIYQSKKGIHPKPGQRVVVAYKVSLLTGEVCYDSKTAGNLEFEINRGGAVNGLHEGIILMNQGEKAKLIVPSHLAFGLLGDQNKIPQRATLIYDIELLSII